MSKDVKGKFIDVGDRIKLEGVVEKLSKDETFATVAIVPTTPYKIPHKIIVPVAQIKIIEKFESHE